MQLNKENYLTNDDINNLVKKEKEKIKLIDLLVKIYTNYDKTKLKELIKDQDGKKFSKSIFDLIKQRQLKLEDFHFENNEELNLFQKNLLSSGQEKNEINKDDINNILNFSKSLTNCLKFLSDNIQIVYDSLDNFVKWYNLNNYELTIPSAKNEENVEDIFNSLQNIINYTKQRKTFYS